MPFQFHNKTATNREMKREIAQQNRNSSPSRLLPLPERGGTSFRSVDVCVCYFMPWWWQIWMSMVGLQPWQGLVTLFSP